MLYIAHTSIWLPVSFVPPHHKQLIELNHMPFIAHATKTRTVFDASIIANVLYIYDGFHTTLFAMRRNKRNGQPDEGVCDIRLTVYSDELFVIRQHKGNG